MKAAGFAADDQTPIDQTPIDQALTDQTPIDQTGVVAMLADMAGDIIIRTDAKGFVEDASTGLSALGIDLEELLINPHISDLAKPSHMRVVRDYFRLAMDSVSPAKMISFPAVQAASDPRHSNDADTWYSLTLRPAPEGSGSIGIMRPASREGELKRQLKSVCMTDQLTGMGNRKAFETALSEALITGQSGAAVLIEIDHFRAITLRFGPSMGDEVIAAFAQFLSRFASAGAVTARMEGERFAVFLPTCDLGQALSWTQDMIASFARISAELGCKKTQITASAGVAKLSGSTDRALSRAELGVSVAKASGGKRTECGDWLHGCANAETIGSRRGLVAAA